MSKLASLACTRCGLYSQEHEGLCGNCLLADGKTALDYDPWAQAKKQRHDAEVRQGILRPEDLVIARIEAKDLPRGDLEPGLHKKGAD